MEGGRLREVVANRDSTVVSFVSQSTFTYSMALFTPLCSLF